MVHCVLSPGEDLVEIMIRLYTDIEFFFAFDSALTTVGFTVLLCLAWVPLVSLQCSMSHASPCETAGDPGSNPDPTARGWA